MTTRRISPQRRLEGAIRMSQRLRSQETVNQISLDTRISRKRLYELEEAYEQGRSLEDKPRSGRPRKATTQMAGRVIRTLQNDPTLGFKEVRDSVNIGLPPQNQISDRTVRGIALEYGLHSRRPAFKPLLDEEDMAARLEWAQDHQDKNMRFWGHVIFSDETKVELFPTDRRVRVRRPIHKRFCGKYVVRHIKGVKPSLMYWGCITLHGQGRLEEIIDRLDGPQYAGILQRCLPEIIRGQNLRAPILQEDNLRLHTSPDPTRVKENLGVRRLDWPSRSPDLNPIEGLWSYLKDRVRRRLPQTLEALERITLQEWARIPPIIIASHVRSIPKRIQALITAKGGDIKY